MKKLLSLVLAMLMILSTVSFAAPAMVGSVADVTENVAEVAETVADVTVQEDVANLAAESQYGVLVYDIGFDTAQTTFGATVDKYGTVNLPAGFPEVKVYTGMAEASIANGVATGKTTGGYPTMVDFSSTGLAFPDGIYTIMCDIKQITTDKTGYSARIRLEGTGKQLGLGSNIAISKDAVTAFSTTVTVADGKANNNDYTPVKKFAIYINAKMSDVNYVDTFEWDNLKMYYKPLSAKLTLDANGNTEAKNCEYVVKDTTKTVDLDALKALMMKGVENKIVVGFSTTPNGPLVPEKYWANYDTTLYAQWKDIAPKNAQYGKMLFLLDFENITEESDAYYFYNGKPYMYDMMPLDNSLSYYDPSFDAANVRWDARSAAAIHGDIDGLSVHEGFELKTDADGNTYASNKITGNYPIQVFLADVKNGAGKGKYDKIYDSGVFTFIYDTFTVGKPNNFGHFYYPINANGVESQQSKNVTFGSNKTGDQAWIYDYTYTYDFDIDSFGDYNVGFAGFSIGYTGKTNAEAGYDNIKLYWKPYTVNVTIDANGNSEAKNVVYTADTSAKVDIDALNAKMSNTANKYFLGVSLTPDGELLTEDFWASEDTTVYAQWKDVALEHEQYGDLIYFTDFEDFSNAGSFYGTKADGTVYLKEGWSLSKLGYTVAPDFDSSKVYFDARGFGSDAVLKAQLWNVVTDEVTGNTYVTHPVENGDPIQIIYADKGIYKNGVLTLVHDTMAKNTPNSYHDGYWINGDNQTYKWINSKFTGTAGAWEYDKAYVYDVDTAKHADFEYLYGIFFGYVGKATAQASYDNLRLYWKPYTANITINMNGNADKTVEAYANDTSSKLSLAELTSHVGTETANYTLKGFSKTADGELLTADFWANEDTTLYAVWEAKTVVAPTSCDLSAIRTDAYTGIRFKASITKAQKEEVTEYGFIVTLEKNLGGKELTHTAGVAYVEGINYGVVDGENVDKIYEIVDDDVFFTAVVYGIPETKAAYESNFVVRPFSKRGGYYYYGNPVVRSVYSVATAIREGGYDNLKESEIAKIDSILAICEK